MTSIREFIEGPWRAVPVLGVTQIISWGSIFYTPVLIVPLIAQDRGWSISFAMGGFSAGLLAAGLVAPFVGRSIDRFGGHVVMTIGSLIGALGLFLIVHAASKPAYLAVWVVLGVAMAANLYDSAFATLGRIFGAAARKPITALTLAGGFASTVSWPTTHFLIEAVGWQGTYLVYAALLACVSAPLHFFALPRSRHEVDVPAARRRTAAGQGFAAARVHLRAGRIGLCVVRLRAVRPVGASAGDVRALGDRCRHGGVDRRAVWAGASRRAADRIHLRARPCILCGWRASRFQRCCAPSSCWRCWAYRRRWRPLSR